MRFGSLENSAFEGRMQLGQPVAVMSVNYRASDPFFVPLAGPDLICCREVQ